VQLSIPLIDGRLALDPWQGIYLFEHCRRPHRRSMRCILLGSKGLRFSSRSALGWE
jgi:thiamine phosphate synthase YjbQ (UPF0047 family)